MTPNAIEEVVKQCEVACCKGEDLLFSLTDPKYEGSLDTQIVLVQEILSMIYQIRIALDKCILGPNESNIGRVFRHKELGLIYYEGSRILSQPHIWKPEKWEEVRPYDGDKDSFEDLIKQGDWVRVSKHG